MSLRLGVLLADELRDNLAPRFGDYAQMFKRLLAGQADSFSVYDIRAGAGAYPQSLNECDAYLVTGSRHGVYDNLPWLPPLFDFIRALAAAKKPLAGVCFGHQAVAQALGGRAKKSPKGWGVGLQYWRVCKNAAWMRPPAEFLRLFCMHQDQVVAPPPGAQLLAASAFCPNAAFAVQNHVFCVQGHPEFTPDFMRELLKIRQDDMPADELRFAHDTAALPQDSALTAQWLGAFFRQNQ